MMLTEFNDYTMWQHRQQPALSEQWARELYIQATKIPWWQRFFQALTGGHDALLPLNQVVAGHKITGQHDAGLQRVPIRQICGSENKGRCADFDGRFRPRNSQLIPRWLKVAKAWYCGIELPPVTLIRLGSRYFVRDGHHRISVAAAAGQDSIWAYVLERHLSKAGS